MLMLFRFQTEDPEDMSLAVDAEDFTEALAKVNLGLCASSSIFVECPDDEANAFACALIPEGPNSFSPRDVRGLRLISHSSSNTIN